MDSSPESGQAVNRSTNERHIDPCSLVLAAALEAWVAGLAPIPIRMDGSKRPALAEWNGRTHKRFARAEVERLFAEPRALGIVCGPESGGLELLEVEGAAVEEGIWERLYQSWPSKLRERACSGYLEFSPSGGVHLLYRVEGGVAGNTKLARRPRPDLGKACCDTLVETRGHGGYVVVAPSPGAAHETGIPWELHSGGFASIATVTAEERETLIAAARVFDEMPEEPARKRLVVHKRGPHDVYIGRPSKWANPFKIGEHGTREEVIAEYEAWIQTQPELLAALPELRGKVLGCWCAPEACHGDVLTRLAAELPVIRGAGLRPGEDFDGRHTCGEVLERAGWTVARRRGDEVYWCRPGKSPREGHSGIEHLDSGLFVNWSSSVDLECERGYSPFALLAHLEHGGDFQAAARELGKQGYGERSVPERVKSGQATVRGRQSESVAPDALGVVDEAGGPVEMAPEASIQVSEPAPGTPSPNGWRKLSAADLVTTDFPEPNWIVPGWLPEGLAIFGGRPKARKSWLAMQLAIAKACGGRFLDRLLEVGPVVYFALEDGERRLAKRLRALECPRQACELTFHTGMPPLGKGGLEHIEAEVEVIGAELVVIDTAARAMVGNARSDQDKSADMTAVLGPLQHFALERHLALLVIDHLRKPGVNKRNLINDVMGSTAKVGVADTIWGLHREQGEHRGILSMVGRDVEDGDWALEFRPTPLAWTFVGDVEELGRSEAEQRYLDAVRVLGPIDTTSIADYLGVTREAAGEELRRLRDKGKVIAEAKRQGSGRPTIQYTIRGL